MERLSFRSSELSRMDFRNILEIGSFVGPTIIAVLGYLKIAVRVADRVTRLEEARKADIDTRAQTSNQLMALHTELERISVALVGLDGSNGLRGEIRELKTDVKDLWQRFNTHTDEPKE